MSIIGKVIGGVGEEAAASADVIDPDRGSHVMVVWMKPLGRIKGTAFGSTESKQDQTELI